MKFFICARCGNIVASVREGGGTLSCCGEPMKELTANSTDAASEKHVPVIAVSGQKVTVKVGSVPHPMADEHYIEWIAVETPDKMQRHVLEPGEAPEAEFCVDSDDFEVFAYCNLHGLWKTDLTAEEDFVIPNEAACSAEFQEGCIIPE